MDYILRGRAAYWRPNSREKWADTIGLFENALALDPHSVEARAWLANALVARATDGRTNSRGADMRRAEELVGEAIAAAPRNWFAHYAKAGIRRFQGRCEEAIPEYEAALALNPNWLAAFSRKSGGSSLTRAKIVQILAHELEITRCPCVSPRRTEPG